MKKAVAVVVPLHYGFRATSESVDANAALHLRLMTRSAFVYKVLSANFNTSLFAYPCTNRTQVIRLG